MIYELSVDQKVKIKSHRHPDIAPGTAGIVDIYMQNGYGVKVTGMFQIAGGDRGQKRQSTEVFWYPEDELEVVQ